MKFLRTHRSKSYHVTPRRVVLADRSHQTFYVSHGRIVGRPLHFLALGGSHGVISPMVVERRLPLKWQFLRAKRRGWRPY